MRIFKYLITTMSFSLLAASPAAFAQAKGYSVLPDAQPTESGKKVEVTEFFGYSCPHCNSIDPGLAEWVKKQGDNIVFKRVPVGFSQSWVPHQKLYYALEALGKTEEFHHKVFKAIHVDRQPLRSEDEIIAFMAKNGMDKQKFTDALNSFTVAAKVKRASQIVASYKVEQVPLVAIDGRYMTSPVKAAELIGDSKPEHELHALTFKIMDDLVAKSRKK